MNNWRGFYTLFAKEVRRFLKVSIQTILAPVVTVLLYLLVFSSVLPAHTEVYPGVSYANFLVPGLIIMAILQNAFANSSSSLYQAKQNGNLVFMQLAPISDIEFYLAFVGAAIVRGVLVGLGVWLTTIVFVAPVCYNAWIIGTFAILGCGLLGALGLIAAVISDKWDHLSAFQNFVILPLSFLSGVFYSIHQLPPFWTKLSWYNPFFYMIDGFRYGFLGVSDAAVSFSFLIVASFFAAVSAFAVGLLHSGYKMRD